MRTPVLAVAALLVVAACGVSTQDEPEPIGTTSVTGEAPTPVVTQRRHSTTVPSSSTSSTPMPTTAGDR
ncbi:hypothetical protein SAMN05216553_105106 [Lentzea fradiae]|uniref:Uncharacterized protein n=1 Tax=Lentzea fradiae TaxID=200378 RepID=A0A1G7R4C6_9PSEU|nr:hypothetical protein [Lentzea fradiae]SDG05613.1 hypothetical protein SAMN05216553_105106 [Lentzea fradiae]